MPERKDVYEGDPAGWPVRHVDELEDALARQRERDERGGARYRSGAAWPPEPKPIHLQLERCGADNPADRCDFLDLDRFVRLRGPLANVLAVLNAPTDSRRSEPEGAVPKRHMVLRVWAEDGRKLTNLYAGYRAWEPRDVRRIVRAAHGLFHDELARRQGGASISRAGDRVTLEILPHGPLIPEPEAAWDPEAPSGPRPR